MQEKSRIDIHQIFWYFFIFSILGFFIETVYCYITSGVIESRKGVLWGPISPIYGIGGVLLILILNRANTKSSLKLFIYGFIVGSIVEYLTSYMLEALYSIRYWEYSYIGLNLNGRICVPFSICWGILGIILIKHIQPFTDKLINKINFKHKNVLEIGLTVFLIVNFAVTGWAINVYKNRAQDNFYGKRKEQNKKSILINLKENIENNYFTNDRMVKDFPNIRYKDYITGKEIWVRDMI